MHLVSPLNSKERSVVAQSSSWIKEWSVEQMTQVLVQGKEPRLSCPLLVGTVEVITEEYGEYACE